MSTLVLGSSKLSCRGILLFFLLWVINLFDVAFMRLSFTFCISFGRGSNVAILLSNRTFSEECRFGPLSTALNVFEVLSKAKPCKLSSLSSVVTEVYSCGFANDGDNLFPLLRELSSPSRETIELSIRLALARLDWSNECECSCWCRILVVFRGDSDSWGISRFTFISPLILLGNILFGLDLDASLERLESSAFLKIDGATAANFRLGDS